MALDLKEVAAIAEYARLALSPEELEHLMSSLNNDLDGILSVLATCDVTDVEPTFHPTGGHVNVMRDDVPMPSMTIEDALMNACDAHERFFRVPSILGKSGDY